ncbi:MAG: hypothetical protein PHE84_00245 [bacterium]|nr:hypothetical protein [bacterium]
MICKLCLQDKELCSSHIIPEFLFKPTYDEKHRAHQLTIEPLNNNYIQKGIREELLCKSCEGKINKYETYFSQEWPKKLPKEIPTDLCLIENLDYEKFKLFHLSILWRASISKKEFKNITLGPHEEIIRKMLFYNNPGPEYKYCFFAKIIVDDNNNVVQGIIVEPMMSRLDAHHAFVFIFGGCTWHYLISNHSPEKKYLDICFSKKGHLWLIKEYIKDNKYITNSIREYKKRESMKNN